MNAFIEMVLKKKRGAGNPVRKKSQCMEMKKHMGWDKVMRGLGKA